MIKPIKISFAASALILYDRLNIKHAKCNLTKKPNIDCEQEDIPPITKLLTLSFTLNVRK
jgi:hypothetical protein